jgi:hypothetical protein
MKNYFWQKTRIIKTGRLIPYKDAQSTPPHQRFMPSGWILNLERVPIGEKTK